MVLVSVYANSYDCPLYEAKIITSSSENNFLLLLGKRNKQTQNTENEELLRLFFFPFHTSISDSHDRRHLNINIDIDNPDKQCNISPHVRLDNASSHTRLRNDYARKKGTVLKKVTLARNLFHSSKPVFLRNGT